jgi:integrase
MANSKKKDIHHIEQSFRSALCKLENDNSLVQRNRELILSFIRERKLSHWLDKPFDSVTQADMEGVIEGLENNKYKREIKDKKGRILRSSNLAHSTKLDYKKTLRKFYKWLLGDNDHYPELVDWIDTFDIEKEIPALRREEIERLAEALKLRDKAILMFLFDSGARAAEFLNITIGDLTKVDNSFKARIAFSKTKPRTIHLPICSKYLELWLQESKEKDEHNYLFPISYEALRRMLYRVGKKVLNKRVTPHILRHSSATYYANLLKSPYKLCYRYGWSMASQMPKRYIDREGIIEEETPDLVRVNDISKLEKQNQDLKEEISMVKESNSNLTDQIEKIKNELNQLHRGKDLIKVLLSAMKLNREKSKILNQTTDNKFDIVLPTSKLILESENIK